jgi:hypothetical protein
LDRDTFEKLLRSEVLFSDDSKEKKRAAAKLKAKA